VETGYLVPRKTRAGVRYVRSRKRRPYPRSPGDFVIGVLVILSAAAVAASILLVTNPAAAAGWQSALGFLYPLQLILDLVAVARFCWTFIQWRLGDLELELSGDRLRFGIRCGPLWFDSESIVVTQVKRLVVVKRLDTERKSGTIWELVAEQNDGSPMRLVSADDPENVVPLAKDLHARLARRENLCDSWPALAEEDRPGEVLPDRPPRRPLLPGGGWTWLAIHVIGSAGLWQVSALPCFKLRPRPVWQGFVLVSLVALQALIFLTNITFMTASRRTTQSPSAPPGAQ
jgi:hypothetical protein